MNPKTQQQRRELRRHRAALATAVLLVAALPASARGQQTTREVAAKKWYASRSFENRSSGSRTSRRPSEEARQQVRLTSGEPAGRRAQERLAPAAQEGSWYQPARSTWTMVNLSEEAAAAQMVLEAANQGGTYCGMSALPAMGLTAVGLLGFSGAARRRPQSQNEW